MVQLVELLGNRNLIKILNYFLKYSSIKIYQKDLQIRLKISKVTLIKWLKFLVKEDILEFKKYGRVKIFYLNRFDSAVRNLKILYNLLDLRDLKKIEKEYDLEIFLYGSCARGENVSFYKTDNIEKSDIDILVIGKIYREKLYPYIEKLSKKIKRKINFQIFSDKEWLNIYKKDKAFYERVEKDKVKV